MFQKINVCDEPNRLHGCLAQIVWNLTHPMQAFVPNVLVHNKRKGFQMKKIIALAVAFAAVAIVSAPEANAQSYNQGYQFGAGVSANRNFNPRFGFGTFFGSAFQNVQRQVRPPYFAEFPPVYYNGIVRRPYGISPYAAPAGIAPVELNHAVQGVEPAVVKNPFFNKNNAAPISVIEKVEDSKSTKNKSTKISNPFFKSNMEEEPGSIMHASYDVVGN